MTKLLFTLTLLIVAPLAAVDIGLVWKPSPSVGVTQYRIYTSFSTNGTNYGVWTLTNTVPASQLYCYQTNLSVGWHRWYATSASDMDESGPSEIVTYRVFDKPLPPLELTLTATNKLNISISVK